MAKMLVNCPSCRKPITADIEQLFDVGVDPSAKQRLLSGAYNQIRCPLCGYQGIYPSIIVYHDPDKGLLLTFVPTELGLPRNEQERVTGALITKVVNNLPLEKRKGYLFNPQATLTMQGLVERVLEADGITREMIQDQQLRLNLIQRLLNITGTEARVALAQQEDALIDETFFALFNRITQSAAMSGDQEAAAELTKLQQEIIPVTTYGRELQAQSKEVEAAMRDLQRAGQKLNREKLLDLASHASSDTYLRALVSLARPVMDYQFFQMLSERIDRSRGDGRARLTDLREKLLSWTAEVDQQIAAHVQEVRQLLNAILDAEDVTQATAESLSIIDEFFVQEVNTALTEAREQGNLEKLSKLQKVIAVLEKASAQPPEVELIEELLDVSPELDHKSAWEEILRANTDRVTPEFLSALSSIAAQVQSGEDKEFASRITELNRVALRFAMQRNLNAP
jgi:hypothetical protein